MKALGRYDTALQMFVEEPREAKGRTLEEVRWRVENGLMGHRPMLGRPTGDYARLFGYERSDGGPIKTAVISAPTPEGARVRLEGYRRGERV